MKERSIVRFEQGIKSRSTLNNYRDHLKNFKLFAKFNNTEEGYNFTPIFTRDEFLEQMTNADLLYKSQAFLIWLYIGSATVNHAFQIP